MPLPLAGIRVLDLTRVLAGPWCTMTLADLGAEVWKIEHPDGGDDTRRWSPPEIHGVSTYYLSVNRNKQSVAINLGTEAGRDLVRGLVRHADVLVENFRPSTLERWGLGYKTLSALNERLVYCSISSYGRDNEFADRPGYDFVLQAECGFMAITGEPDGPPMRLGVAFVDLFTGMNAVQGILAALIARERSGRGQAVDVALFNSGLQCLANVASGYLNTRIEPGRYGNAHPSIVPYEMFASGDGRHLAIAVGNDEQYRKLCCEVLGAPELWDEERYRTNRGRTTHRGDLVPALGQRFARHSADLLLMRLRQSGIPSGEVRSVGAALESAEAAARSAIATVQSASLGELRMVASPLRFSHTPVAAPAAPPALGEHTAEVLSRVLGIESAAIAELRTQGVVA